MRCACFIPSLLPTPRHIPCPFSQFMHCAYRLFFFAAHALARSHNVTRSRRAKAFRLLNEYLLSWAKFILQFWLLLRGNPAPKEREGFVTGINVGIIAQFFTFRRNSKRTPVKEAQTTCKGAQPCTESSVDLYRNLESEWSERFCTCVVTQKKLCIHSQETTLHCNVVFLVRTHPRSVPIDNFAFFRHQHFLIRTSFFLRNAHIYSSRCQRISMFSPLFLSFIRYAYNFFYHPDLYTHPPLFFSFTRCTCISSLLLPTPLFLFQALSW